MILTHFVVNQTFQKDFIKKTKVHDDGFVINFLTKFLGTIYVDPF